MHPLQKSHTDAEACTVLAIIVVFRDWSLITENGGGGGGGLHNGRARGM